MREDSQAGLTHPPLWNSMPRGSCAPPAYVSGTCAPWAFRRSSSGSAGIVVAAGISRSFRTIAPMLPETLRELKSLIDASRDARTLKP